MEVARDFDQIVNGKGVDVESDTPFDEASHGYRMNRMGKPIVVVNGDDFGVSSRVNLAIVESFRKKLISSATIIANMAGFEEACALTHEHGLNGSIGVHLTLTAGSPLTEPIRRCARFCNSDGMFVNNTRTIWHLSHNEKNALWIELVAQVDATIAHGIIPTHFDSHHHFHTYWPISTIIIQLARKYRIPAVRLSRNCGLGLGSFKRLYKTLFNLRLICNGMAPTRHFGSSFDSKKINRFSGPLEIMVHPRFDECGHLIDTTFGKEKLEDISAWWRRDCELINYKYLCNS